MDDNHYRVQSQTTNQKWYDVVSTESGWSCNCPDHTYRQVCCKHIHAVEFSVKLRKEVLEKTQTVIEQVSCNECPDCQGVNFVKHGIRHNKNYDLQRYFCNDCNKWFSFNLGFNGIKVNPKAVTSALQLYFTGESLRNVQKFLRLQGIEVSHQTIYNWIKKYTGLMEKYLEKITPQVSDTWRADEVWLKVKGDKKYLFAMMDEQTRFWIAQEVADTKFRHNAQSLLRMSKEFAGKTPVTFVTDGLPAYNDAFRREFWTMKNLPNGKRPEHIRHISIKGDKNNNMMERLNGEFRDREKTFRGLKKKDSPAIAGIRIYHNYVRPHSSLDGQTPADRAGIIIKGNDKWRTLIENASLG
ncbi:MAG: DDE-type integrase/transposase/recombinase [Thaumarchaeota archaeon]|nr:DDE-type integrase/transposase/recombinase [Nitrososphaerota archaeon]